MLKFGAKKGDRWNYNIGSVASGTFEMVDLFEFAGQTIAIIKNEEEDTGVRPIHSRPLLGIAVASERCGSSRLMISTTLTNWSSGVRPLRNQGTRHACPHWACSVSGEMAQGPRSERKSKTGFE